MSEWRSWYRKGHVCVFVPSGGGGGGGGGSVSGAFAAKKTHSCGTHLRAEWRGWRLSCLCVNV